jgi:hypothetical protein
MLSGHGEGVIVTPGAELPAQLITDAKAQAATRTSGANATMVRQMGALQTAMESAGVSAFFLYLTGTEQGEAATTVNYTVNTNNVSGAKAFWQSIGGGKLGYPTKEAALAEIAPLTAANPTIPVIDLSLGNLHRSHLGGAASELSLAAPPSLLRSPDPPVRVPCGRPGEQVPNVL